MTALPLVVPDLSEAKCREIGGDVFFPEKGDAYAAPKRVCTDCPVQAACLQWAMDRDEPHGIWGGFSPNERYLLRRSRRRAAA